MPEWDYSALAKHYDKRADYSAELLRKLFAEAGLHTGDPVADVGAGTGKLTVPLLTAGLKVDAVEPNDEMRSFGVRNTGSFPDVAWHAAAAENTGLQTGRYRAVMFGSSFNVTNRQEALREAHRLLVPGGHFVCMWNHRDLDDPIQHALEDAIRAVVPEYSYGTRREDPTEVIAASGLFEPAQAREQGFVVQLPRDDILDAWRSHATLARQAKDKFDQVIASFERILPPSERVAVPYTTRAWIARRR